MNDSKLLRSSKVKCAALDASRYFGTFRNGPVEICVEINLTASVDKVVKRASLQDASKLIGLSVLSKLVARSKYGCM